MGKRVIISVINDLVGDQRVHRIASTLQESGFEVLVIGRKLPDSLPVEGRPYRTYRMHLLFKKGKFFYLEYNFRLFWELLFRRVNILNSNDLDTLLANFLVSTIKGKQLVYDSHEYFTEVPELIDRPRTRSIWLRLERWIFPRLKQAYTVNASIADIYTGKYGVNVGVVRNVPFRREVPSISSPKQNILIYQGALNLGRGIDLMIRTMTLLPDYVLWIVGRGDVQNELKDLTEKLSLQDRVVFKGFVPFKELHAITCQAKLGLSLEEDRGLNYRYASPNKLVDYIQAHVPFVSSDLPEMRRLVDDFGVGKVLNLDTRTPEALAPLIKEICETPTDYQQYVENCKAAAQTLNWEREKQRLLQMYSGN